MLLILVGLVAMLQNSIVTLIASAALNGMLSVHRVRTHQWDLLQLQPEAEWKLKMRLGRVLFNAIVDQLAKLPVFQQYRNVGNRGVTVAQQLAMFLMRFGNDKVTVMEVAHFFDASSAGVTAACRRVAEALPKAFPKTIYFEPNGPQKDKEMAAFAAKGWQGCRAIFDVTNIGIVVPTHTLTSSSSSSSSPSFFSPLRIGSSPPRVASSKSASSKSS
jgi:hypothetical protein